MVYGQGRAASKDLIAQHVALDAGHFHYRPDVVAYCRKAKAGGRRVVLATGSERRWADAVDRHFPGLFDAVYATEHGVNLTGVRKLDAMIKDGGEAFEYLGDSHADKVIFKAAKRSGWIGVKRLKISLDHPGLHRMHTEPTNAPGAVLRLLRPHQWTKNMLVLLPLLTAHKWNDAAAVGHVVLALAAMCLVASAGYVLNDGLDIDADQRHPNKRDRPIARGDVTLIFAAGLLVVLLAVGFMLALAAGAKVLALVVGYFVLSLAYTFFLKRRLLVDVITLAALYSWRPVVGGVAAGVMLSESLVIFCAFFFASLSLLKRYTELKPHGDADRALDLPGRGYQPQDLPTVQNVGLMCGVAAVLVLAFYVQTPLVIATYRHPYWLWAWCPLVGYWLVRAWLLAGRGTLHHDPVVFAFTDTRSYGVIAGMLIAALLAGARAAS